MRLTEFTRLTSFPSYFSGPNFLPQSTLEQGHSMLTSNVESIDVNKQNSQRLSLFKPSDSSLLNMQDLSALKCATPRMSIHHW